jgi:hypothetical protein
VRAFEHLPITANGRIGEREKGASEKRRDDAQEEDLHDGHAWHQLFAFFVSSSSAVAGRVLFPRFS